MADEGNAGLQALARIEGKLETVDGRLESHGRDLRDLKASEHRNALATQAGLGEVKQAIALTDQTVEHHEAEDDRRFHEVQAQMANGGVVPNGRARQVAKGGGLVVGGGGITLILLELLKLLGPKAG